MSARSPGPHLRAGETFRPSHLTKAGPPGLSAGVAFFALLPKRVADRVVAGMFLVGAIYVWREGAKDETVTVERRSSCRMG